MKRFSITIEWGKVEPDSPPQREAQADATIELSDPVRNPQHELDRRPIGFGGK
jgi:hypothetical protein